MRALWHACDENVQTKVTYHLPFNAYEKSGKQVTVRSVSFGMEMNQAEITNTAIKPLQKI